MFNSFKLTYMPNSSKNRLGLNSQKYFILTYKLYLLEYILLITDLSGSRIRESHNEFGRVLHPSQGRM